MKIRSDFVTNSSSSSFVTIKISTKNDYFAETLDEGECSIYDATDFAINTITDLQDLIKGTLVYNYEIVSECAKGLVEQTKNVNVEDIECIQVTQNIDGYKEYRWYSGKTREWYDSKKEMTKGEEDFYKERHISCSLVGTGYHGRPENHERMSEGDKVELIREPNNEKDRNAILVCGNGKELGYFSKSAASVIAWQLDSGKFVVKNARVERSTPRSKLESNYKNPIMTIGFDIVSNGNVPDENDKTEGPKKSTEKGTKASTSKNTKNQSEEKLPKKSSKSIPAQKKEEDKASSAKKTTPKTTDDFVDMSVIGDLDPKCFKIQGTVLVDFFKKYLKKNKEIVIPEGITDISNNAFSYKDELTGIKLPGTLKSIGNDAFYGCDSLKEMLVPKSVEEIGVNPFNRCKALEKIEVEEGNEHFKSVDGVLYSADMSRLISYPSAKAGESFEIPQSVKTIGEHSFNDAFIVKVILISKSVEEIGDNPFSSCESLEKIEVEEGNKHFKSVDGVLYSSDMSRLISYPRSKAGESFETPESVKTIGKYSFSLNKNLKKLVLNKGLKTLDTFCGNKTLTEIVINEGPKELPRIAFWYCTSLENVTIAEGVTKLAKESFEGCDSLKRVVIPESVKTMGECKIKKNPNLVIVCKENSAAHKYCINHKIACEIDGVAQPSEKKKSEMTDEEILKAPMTAKEKAVVEREKQLYSKSVQALDLIKKTNEIANSLNMPVDLDDVADYFKKFEMFNGAEDDDILISLRRDGIAAATRVCDNVDKLSGEVRETYEMAVARQEEEGKAAVARKVAEDNAAERKRAAAAAAARDQQPKTQPASQSQTYSPQSAQPQKKKGCYVATAVYGSYDCPEVWTLRRFRDYKLASTWLGRLFIFLYYAISPTLVKLFGSTKTFNLIFRKPLDKFVEKLNSEGFDSTPYEDRYY